MRLGSRPEGSSGTGVPSFGSVHRCATGWGRQRSTRGRQVDSALDDPSRRYIPPSRPLCALAHSVCPILLTSQLPPFSSRCSLALYCVYVLGHASVHVDVAILHDLAALLILIRIMFLPFVPPLSLSTVGMCMHVAMAVGRIALHDVAPIPPPPPGRPSQERSGLRRPLARPRRTGTGRGRRSGAAIGSRRRSRG